MRVSTEQYLLEMLTECLSSKRLGLSISSLRKINYALAHNEHRLSEWMQRESFTLFTDFLDDLEKACDHGEFDQ